jgi:hypothetical protein
MDPTNCNDPGANEGVCKIVDEDEGIGRCDNPGQFAPAGELCGPNTNECCPGVPEGKLYCHRTFFGVERCLLCKPEGQECTNNDECCGSQCSDGTCGGGDEPACVPDGAGCATPDECCGKICAPNATGALLCQSTCIPVSGVCTTSSDCCTGSCVAGECGDREVECRPLGAGCAAADECCSGACNNQTCQILIE